MGVVEAHGARDGEGRVEAPGNAEIEHDEPETGRDLEVVVHGHPADLGPAAGAHPEDEQCIENDDDDGVVPRFHGHAPREASRSASILSPQ